MVSVVSERMIASGCNINLIPQHTVEFLKSQSRFFNVRKKIFLRWKYYKTGSTRSERKKMMKKPYQYSIAEEYSRLLFYIYFLVDSRFAWLVDLFLYAPHETQHKSDQAKKHFIQLLSCHEKWTGADAQKKC